MKDEQQLPGFGELGLSAPIVEALTAVGYESPSPIQAQTGTGRSAIYLR